MINYPKFCLGFKLFIVLAFGITIAAHGKATVHIGEPPIWRSPVSHADTDSLIQEYKDYLFNSINNPKFWAEVKTPAYILLKIDFDATGKVKSIRFSDSTDTLFVSAFNRQPKYHNYQLTLETYAQKKGYKDVSLLIPIYYEPHYDTDPGFYISYNRLEMTVKFDGKEFRGKSIILSPIIMRVLSKGNM